MIRLTRKKTGFMSNPGLKFFLFTGTFLLLVPLYAQVKWARGYGVNAVNEVTYKVGFDAQGNHYICGRHGAGSVVEGETLAEGGIFLLKLDENGRKVWLKAFDKVVSGTMAVAGDGTVYLFGAYSGNLTIDGQTINSGNNDFGGTSVFAVKYATDGTKGWLRSFEANKGIPVSAALANNGDIILAGTYRTSINFNDGKILSSWSGLQAETFLARIGAADGAAQWLVQTASKYETGVSSLTLDPDGNIYIAGYFRRDSVRFSPAVAFYPQSRESNQNNKRNVFIARYGPDGSFTWAKQVKGQGYQNAAVAYCNGHLYTVLGVTDYFVFGNDSLAGSANYLVQLDAGTGSSKWQRRSGFFHSIVADADAVFYSNAGANSAMAVVKLDKDGNELRTFSKGGGGGSTLQAGTLAIRNGKLLMGGIFRYFDTLQVEPGIVLVPSALDFDDGWYALLEDSVIHSGTVNTTIHNLEFSIYPNPAGNMAGIGVSGRFAGAALHVQVSDLAGREVLPPSVLPADGLIHVDTLVPGIYFVTVSDRISSGIKKLVISR